MATCRRGYENHNPFGTSTDVISWSCTEGGGKGCGNGLVFREVRRSYSSTPNAFNSSSSRSAP